MDSKKDQMRLGRVVLKIEYIVDLNDERMVRTAKSSIVDDVKTAVYYGELVKHIEEVPDDTLKPEDIPSFLSWG